MHPPLPACYAAKNNNTPRKNFLGVSVSPIFPSSYEIYPSVPRSPPSSSSSSVDWAEEEEKSFVRFPQGKTKLFPFFRSPSKGDERNKLISLSTPPLLCGGRYTWAGSMGVSPPVGPAPFGTLPRTPTSSNSVTQRTRIRQTSFYGKSRKSNDVSSNTVFQAI